MTSIAEAIARGHAAELQSLADTLCLSFSVQQESELGLVNATPGDIMETILAWAQEKVGEKTA
jgi:hypothetical protein